MNHTAPSLTSLPQGLISSQSPRHVGGIAPHLPAPFPKRVYTVRTTSNHSHTITCDHVVTDEGFLKFYNYIVSGTSASTCSVVAMIPSEYVQLVTSILESEVVIV